MKVILSLILCLLSSPCFATSYYVDCAGSDANNGLTTATAFATTNPVEGNNFLSPGDIVNLKRGCTWSGADSDFEIASDGNISNRIIVQAYGSGADPIFDGGVNVTTLGSWAGWTEHDAVNHIWKTSVAVPWDVQGVIIDDAKLLRRQGSIALLNTLKDSFRHAGSGNVLYVRLRDDSDLNTHSVVLARYGAAGSRGLVRTDDTYGSFVDFNDIKVKNSNWMGFSSSGRYNRFFNCTAHFSARENFYLIKNAVSNSYGAEHNVIKNGEAFWASSVGGQNITIESPYVDVIDTEVAWGWQAGVDWLDYNASTDASFGRCIRCTVHNNAQRAYDQDPSGFDPAAFYIDGGHDIQIIDSYGYITTSTEYTNGNAIPTMAIGTEHPDTKPTYNISVINSKFTGNCYVHISFNVLNCTGSQCDVLYNIKLIGNSFRGTNGSGIIGFDDLNPTGTGVFVYNNILYQTGGAYPYSGTPSANYTGDYNIFYSSSNPSGNKVSSSTTLATWQALGLDAHSIYANPQYVDPNNNDLHLKHIAAGDASDSPGIDLGDASVVPITYSSIGSTRSDGVVDSGSRDVGYHYSADFEDLFTSIAGAISFSNGIRIE